MMAVIDLSPVAQLTREQFHKLCTANPICFWRDPIQKQVEIYRPDQSVETIPFPADLSGEDVLPGFQLRIERSWSSLDP